MASLISKLSKKEQREQFHVLNYLNTGEIKAFCKKPAIPYRIVIENKDGTRRRTDEMDRKGVVLHRVRHFLKTGAVLKEMCFRSSVVCFAPIPEKLSASDRLFYGQYDKSNRTVMALLKNLTDGKFADGAITRMLARELCSRGKAPTFQEYAAASMKARREHSKPNPEWAYLSDRADKGAGAEWRKMRTRKSKRVMRALNKRSVRHRAARG